MVYIFICQKLMWMYVYLRKLFYQNKWTNLSVSYNIFLHNQDSCNTSSRHYQTILSPLFYRILVESCRSRQRNSIWSIYRYIYLVILTRMLLNIVILIPNNIKSIIVQNKTVFFNRFYVSIFI